MPPLKDMRMLRLSLHQKMCMLKAIQHTHPTGVDENFFFFLIPRFKKMFFWKKYKSRSSLCSAIDQCFEQVPKEEYLTTFHCWVQRLQNCVPDTLVYNENI